MYERSVYSFWEFIGLIGGIYEIVDVFFALFVTTYNNRIFLLDVINKKIKVLASSNQNDYEKLSLSMNRSLREEEKKLDTKPQLGHLERSELRKKRSYMKQPIKEFTVTDSLVDYIC